MSAERKVKQSLLKSLLKKLTKIKGRKTASVAKISVILSNNYMIKHLIKYSNT